LEEIRKKIGVIGLKGLPAYGGAAFVGENIIEFLKSDFDFTVYSISSHTELKTGNIGDTKQIVFREIPQKKLNTVYYYIRACLHALTHGRYNLIHLHHRDASFILPLLRIRYKTVLTTHGMVLTEKWKKFSFLFRIQDFLFLRFANYITCVSRKDLSIVTRYKKHNIRYIPNGINIDKIPSRQFNSSEYIIFAAGRIVPSKGCHQLLESLRAIDYKNKLIIVGDYNQSVPYKKKLQDLSTGLDVEFLGLIKDKQRLYDIILKAAFFVYPSRIESMSIMLLEVASLKVPIICGDIQENKDIFDSTEVLFVKSGNNNDLAEKIKWALTHRTDLGSMAEKAFIKLMQKFDWRSITKDYKSLYQKYTSD